MTARGKNFLENWIDGNVTEADKYGSHERAKELAAQLEADAKAQGITLDDLEPVFGSLDSIIYEMMHHGFDG
jgi:nucleotide-binding universal stress UspA family protein